MKKEIGVNKLSVKYKTKQLKLPPKLKLSREVSVNLFKVKSFAGLYFVSVISKVKLQCVPSMLLMLKVQNKSPTS